MDRVLNSIGAFGRYQKLVLILAGLVSSMTATIIYSTVFTTAAPRLLCRFKNETFGNASLVDLEDEPDATTCQMWQALKRNSSAPYECHFDKTYYDATIVTDWELVCEKSWMVSLTVTINLAGAVSGLFIGFFSDRFGRKKCAFTLASVLAFMLTLWQFFHFGIIEVENSTMYIIYCIMQFCSGAMAKSLYTVCYILIFELTTAKHTTIVSNVFSYMYVLGEFLVLVVAYISPNWHIIMLSMSIYAIGLVVLIALFMPESPRFLMAMEYDDRMKKLLKKIAKMNGKVCDTAEIFKQEIEFENVEKSKPHEQSSQSVSAQDENVDVIIHNKHTAKEELSFIAKRKNILRIASFVYIWFALSLTYYGVSLGITSIDEGIDPYLMYLLGSIAELAGYFCCHLNDRFGRRRMMMTFILSSSVICLIVAVIPSSSSKSSSVSWNSVLKIIFASIGKTAVSAAYNSCYIFNSLLFPTHVRTTVLVFTTNVGRIGALISPQINLLQTLVWGPLSYIIFSASALLAAIVVFILPDPDKIKF